MKEKLTAKQKKFADLYIETGNKQKSYLKAYPNAKPASAAAAATRLLKNVKVKAYIDIRQEQIDSEVFKKQIATKERILHEDSCIALARIGDIFDENGNIKKLEDMPEDLQAAIKSVKYDKIKVGTDDQGNAKYQRRLKSISFHDKGAALNRLEKYYGLHGNKRDKNEVSCQFDIRTILAKIDGLNRGKLPQDE
jgi:phage terminase small subunit